jgi:hypothetical protein
MLESGPMDEKELAKQLNTYADSITAFAVVQGVGFLFLIAQNVTLACAVRARWYIAAPLIAAGTYVYYRMVRRCHVAEDDLIGAPVTRTGKIGVALPMIRKARFWLIAVLGFAEILLVIGLIVFPPVFQCPPR